MAKFKVGDRVVLYDDPRENLDKEFIGEVGTVEACMGTGSYHVKMERHIRPANNSNVYVCSEEHMYPYPNIYVYSEAIPDITKVEEFLNG